MAARGARARKIVDKEMKKGEAKQPSKQFAESLDRVKSPRAGAATPAFTSNLPELQSRPRQPGSSVLSSSSSSHSKSTDTSSAVDKITRLGSMSLESKPVNKYATPKGRGSVAPRGRLGGVPIKQTEAQALEVAKSAKLAKRAASRSHTFDQPPQSPTDSSSAVAAFEKSWKNTKSWVGHGQKPRQYDGFEHDDDMWMDGGNCIVFFTEETDEENPKPMLRLHTRVLEQAHSVFISNLLRYGEIIAEKDDDDDESMIDGATIRTSLTVANHSGSWPLRQPGLVNLDDYLAQFGPGQEATFGDFPRPPETPDIRAQRLALQGAHSLAGSDQNAWYFDGQTAVENSPRYRVGSPRIPSSIAETATVYQEPTQHDQGRNPTESDEVEITHEIWFRTPTHIRRPDIQRRHHMATRNYLALLYGLPLIGNDFYEMLSDLQNIMDTYYELNEPPERWDSTHVINQYLRRRKLDDVRNDISTALGLLAWAEQPNVNWDEAYVETFVHAVGMMSQKTMEMREYRNLSQVTRHKLQQAYNATQLNLIDVEERLERFSFDELWYVDGAADNHPAKKSFDSFREWLYCFYVKQYNQWPPSKKHNGRWITRDICRRLQKDFGSLYDYLADREIAWEAFEERHTRKWEMVDIRADSTFEADTPGLPLTTMFIGFDSSQRYVHIPHPYPLLPSLDTPGMARVHEKKRRIFGGLKKSKDGTVPPPKAQFQISLAFNEATNINRLPTDFKDSAMIECFAAYEKTTSIADTSLQDARLGRWILLYGILGVLSTISVDVSGLKYTDKVSYFLNTPLTGIPPWRPPASQAEILLHLNMEEPAQHRSYCWLRAQEWQRERLAFQSTASPAYSPSPIPHLPPLSHTSSSSTSTPPPQQSTQIPPRPSQPPPYQPPPALNEHTLTALKSELAQLGDTRFQQIQELDSYHIHPGTLPPRAVGSSGSMVVNPNGVRTNIIATNPDINGIALRLKGGQDGAGRDMARRKSPGFGMGEHSAGGGGMGKGDYD